MGYSQQGSRLQPQPSCGLRWRSHLHLRTRGHSLPASQPALGAESLPTCLCSLCSGVQVGRMCDTWFYERSISGPANLYLAQLQRRRQRAGA